MNPTTMSKILIILMNMKINWCWWRYENNLDAVHASQPTRKSHLKILMDCIMLEKTKNNWSSTWISTIPQWPFGQENRLGAFFVFWRCPSSMALVIVRLMSLVADIKQRINLKFYKLQWHNKSPPFSRVQHQV